MAAKMATKYTMNANTPTTRSRGMKYEETAGGKEPNVTMNASVAGGKAGMKPKQNGPGMEGTRGMKPTQSNKQGNFSSGYRQGSRS